MTTLTDLTPDDDLFDPLLANANATITVVSTRTWLIDPVTGNVTTGGSVIVPIRAILRKDNTPTQDQLPGIDQKNHVLMGFLVNPKDLPEGTNHLTEATVEFDDENFLGVKRSGKCRLWIPIQNTFVQNKLGIKLKVELVED